jgi:uncharacterized cupin superfamily protein
MITVRTSPAYVNRVRQDWTANGGVYGDGGVYALVPSNDPFAQLGPTLDLTFAGNPTDLLTASTTAGYTLNTYFTPETYQIAVQYAVWDSATGLTQKNFADIVTFTRASTGTYFNSAGTLTTAAINEARFDYNPSTLAAQGLLIEESRTNLALQSEDFATTWTVTGATVSANATSAPSGTTTADKLQEDTSTGSHLVTQNITFTAASHTASIFAKKAERDWIRVLFFDGTNTFSAFFNLNTGTVGTVTGTSATASIQNVGNGWYRCAVTATASAGSGSFAPRVALADNNSSYAGSTGSGIFIWGAQLEVGAFSTSYIPTTTTALTRSADVASVNTLSPWYNATEGTLYGEYQVLAVAPATAAQYVVEVSNGTANNAIAFFKRANADVSTRFSVNDGGSNQAFINAGTFVATASKVAGSYKANDFAASLNGAAAVTDASGSVPSVSVMTLGGWSSGTTNSQLNGYLRRITYYPRRLANADLQAITA